MDTGRLKALVEERVLRHLDHRNLNLDVPWFRDRIPSAENIAVVCWEQLAPVLPGGLSLRLRLWETPRTMSSIKVPEPGVTPAPLAFASKVREILFALGEDPGRPGLLKTPSRVEASLRWLTRGISMSVEDVVGDAVFEENHENMVLVRDIELYSLCEHHLLPFFGRAHVAYIPDGRIIGLSKVPRVVEVFSRRLQVQERLTDQIADALMEVVRPLGVGRGDRGDPSLHGDAGRGEAELPHRDQRAPRRVSGTTRRPATSSSAWCTGVADE